MTDQTTAGAAPEGIPGADTAAPSLEEMAQQLADQKIRSVLSDYEREMADMMAKAQAAYQQQSAAITAQIAQLQGQLAAVRQQAGPPEPLLLANSLAGRVKSIAAANPDLGQLHFTGVIGQAERLAEAVTNAANGTGTVHEAELLTQAVTGWFTRTHPRASSKLLEGTHAALHELERIGEGLAELAPAAAAVAAAV